MSSILDPAKLKVVELRSELSARGLDAKGNKPALVKRLKEALEAELKQDLPDTSIADTSTEDADSSIVEETTKDDKDEPQVEVPEEIPKDEENIVEEVSQSDDKVSEVSEEVTQAEAISQPDETPQTEDTSQPQETNVDEDKEIPSNPPIVEEPDKEEDHSVDEPVVTAPENGDHKPQDEEENVKQEQTQIISVDVENNTDKKESDNEQKGEKRKHSSPSPDRSQRRRSKSPIKEDEPQIDNEKVQLNWYDSDLHLQVDKDSFLSAKPLHEGAFGYAWAGVRATHGVSFGKVCYEVKITEELKWEDLSKIQDRSRRDSYRSSSSSHRNNSEKKVETKTENKKEVEEEQQQSNTESNETSAEQPEEQQPQQPDEVKENENNSEEKMEVEESNKEVENEEKSKPNEEKMETNEEKTEINEETEKKPEPKEIPSHLLRIGWSLLNSDLQLGENEQSFGYESSGKFVINNEFEEYAIKFGCGDVIGAFLSIDDENIVITYTVNGVVQPNAGTLPRTKFPQDNFVLFPHVLSRNYVFEVNLGNMEEPWFPVPIDLQDYEFLAKIEDKISGPVRPESRSDCEVILMCGLPSSGKTHWVQEYIKTNTDKKYTVIGNTHLLEKMTVCGTPLKSNFTGRWSVMLDKLQKCLTKLTDLAALRRRNYIIDQTIVFPSAQRRKMRPFEGFKRRAVVVVVGDEEYARRQALQEAEDGKDVPDTSLLEMKANMSIPTKCDWLDEVVFAELDETAAKEQVQKYNSAGRAAGYGIQRRFDRRDNRFQNRRNDHRGKNYRDRNFHNSRYNRGGNGPRHGNWHHGGGGGGGGNWNRNRRDNRGPPPPPMGGRDWRRNRDGGGGRPNDRNRDNRNPVNNYNRNRSSSGGGGGGGGRNQGGSWQSSSGGGGGGNWGPAGQGWGAQSYGQWGQNWSQTSQNQWKYGGGGGQGYGAYGNWNYYQYPQSWSGQQGQSQQSSGGGGGSGGGGSSGGGSVQSNTSSSGNGTAAQYSQGYSQQAWAQYAQQYAQQAASASATQSTQQK